MDTITEKGKTEIGESRLSDLYKLSGVITSTLEPKKVLDLIIDTAVRFSGATSGSLRLIDRETGTLRLEVSCGLSPEASGIDELKLGEGVTGWAAQTGEALLVPDVTHDYLSTACRPHSPGTPFRVCIPRS